MIDGDDLFPTVIRVVSMLINGYSRQPREHAAELGKSSLLTDALRCYLFAWCSHLVRCCPTLGDTRMDFSWVSRFQQFGIWPGMFLRIARSTKDSPTHSARRGPSEGTSQGMVDGGKLSISNQV